MNDQTRSIATPVVDDTPTKPTRRPYALSLENGFRQVRTNSIEHDALVAGGYVVVEQDDTNTILRHERRAADRRVASRAKYAHLEREVWERIAAEFQEMGRDVDADSLRWAAERFRVLVMRAAGKAQINGVVQR